MARSVLRQPILGPACAEPSSVQPGGSGCGACAAHAKSADADELQIHHVLSDITGKSGLSIVDAILAGKRDPEQLARLADGRIRAERETVIKSLVGNDRSEHLFTLRQSLEADPALSEDAAGSVIGRSSSAWANCPTNPTEANRCRAISGANGVRTSSTSTWARNCIACWAPT